MAETQKTYLSAQDTSSATKNLTLELGDTRNEQYKQHLGRRAHYKELAYTTSQWKHDDGGGILRFLMDQQTGNSTSSSGGTNLIHRANGHTDKVNNNQWASGH